ncbi:hypothetical protein, partial [Yersinia similis]|uniref:hypothetical protein n=1 Tax=Yersinia similis TaxID=367190 RepID=UPI0011A21960
MCTEESNSRLQALQSVKTVMPGIQAVQADLRASGALTNCGEILTRGGLSTDANTLFNSGTLIGATATLNAR